jgi:hypothetical protein
MDMNGMKTLVDIQCTMPAAPFAATRPVLKLVIYKSIQPGRSSNSSSNNDTMGRTSVDVPSPSQDPYFADPAPEKNIAILLKEQRDLMHSNKSAPSHSPTHQRTASAPSSLAANDLSCQQAKEWAQWNGKMLALLLEKAV